jgi:hypothetical protein
MDDRPILDNELIEECQREQHRMRGYCETRDVVARTIVDLMRNRPEFTREQVVWHVGQMAPPT